ncbi:MAG: ABC transporter substrate-binding protein [Vulcanimicrobiaceae bacterium]
MKFLSTLFGLVAVAAVSVAVVRAAEPIPVPDTIKKAGVIRFAADFVQPPGAYFDANHKMTGSDYELCNAIAQRLGVKASWTNLSFGGLIPALGADRFDAICSSMFIKPDRQKVVGFVTYRQTGQAALVVKGNPHHIKSIADYCGVNAVEVLGSVYEKAVRAQNEQCVKEGKPAINVKTFDTTADAVTQVVDGRADVWAGDEPFVVYYSHKVPNAVEEAYGGQNPTLDGIGVAQGADALGKAIAAALEAMHADGTYARIMAKYGLQSGEITSFVYRPAGS